MAPHELPPDLQPLPRALVPSEPFQFLGITIAPGSHRAVNFPVGEFYTLTPAHTPVTIFHGQWKGPVVFITAAIHGDEINGVEIARRLIFDVDWSPLAGTLIMVPVVNLLGFLGHARELPDGRDLNRMFPGLATGSSAKRVAHQIYHHIILRCDYGIDLHTAGRGRTNYPHVRADMRNRKVARLARAFGAPLILDGLTIPDSLRGQACKAGIPTITFEGGEPLKFQRPVIEEGIQGIRNMLVSLEMLPGMLCKARRPLVFRRSKWVRADRAGLVDLLAQPGQVFEAGERLASIFSPFGRELDSVAAPFDCIVLGATTIPTLHPGDPIYHVARLITRKREFQRDPLPPAL